MTSDVAPPPATADEADVGSSKKHSSFWRELPILVIIALALAFVLKTFLIQAFYIPSGSMEDTFRSATA